MLYYTLSVAIYFIMAGIVTKIDPSVSPIIVIFWPIFVPIVICFKIGEYLGNFIKLLWK